MNLKISWEKNTANTSARKLVEETKSSPSALATSPFAMALSDYSSKPRLISSKHQQILLAPKPKANPAPSSSRSLLSRLLSSLRRGASSSRQLRLAETVPLGEKRFVAIIHAEGQRFLIGGGPSSVNLLARLDEQSATLDEKSAASQSLPSLVNLAGAAE